MGQALNCACLDNMNLLEADPAKQVDNASLERLKVLQAGSKFKRNAMLGLTMQEVFLNLTEDASTVKWKIEKSWTSKEEMGEIDMTAHVKILKLAGETGFQFIGMDDKVLFEAKADEASVRDQWVVALNDLLQHWKDHPASKPKSSITAAGTTNKAEYFKRRESDIKAREAAAAEKKSKYASVGMKYTAEAMMRMGDEKS